MSAPTDGYGIYESSNTSQGSSVWGPRLDAIAAAGFSLVMNYGLLHGHIADLTAYIAYAATKSMKVIVALHDPRIWRDNTYAAGYPELYADSGNAATGTLFMQYIVGQLKGLAGVWGWYAGDEVATADVATWGTYSNAIHTADATHPRLNVQGALDPTNCYAYASTGTWQYTEVGGDDVYPLGYTAVNIQNLNLLASGVQTFCTAKSLSSAFVMQAHSWQQYANHVSVYPGEAPWPTKYQMKYQRDTIIANMTPRVVMVYSYFDALSGPPTQVNAISYGIGAQTLENIVAQDIFWRADQAGIASSSWQVKQQASVYNILGTQLQIKTRTGNNYLIYGSNIFDNPIVFTRFVMTSASDFCGVIVRYTDNNNLTYLQIQNGLAKVTSVVGGVSTDLATTAAPTITTSTAYRLRMTCSGATYTINIWLDTAAEPTSATLTVTDTTAQATATGKVGLFAYINNTADQIFYDDFIVTYTARTGVLPLL